MATICQIGVKFVGRNIRYESEIAILRDSNINLQELYQAERVRVINARQKVIDLAKALKPAKAEAIKEFAKRLIADLALLAKHEDEFRQSVICGLIHTIEAKKKEMVGEDK